MEINFFLLAFAFVILTFSGFLLTYAYSGNRSSFSWIEYIALIVIPITLVLSASIYVDGRIAVLFILGSFFGALYEYVIGFTYHKIMKRHLWTYHRFSMRGYTSLLSIPLWGIGTIFFWLLAKSIGL